MKISFLGAANTVTGSKFLVEQRNRIFLTDCGLFQGRKKLRLKNWENFKVDVRKIDFILLTHAHIDHSGYIPKLVKDGFKGNIYSTKATYDLAEIMLQDSAHLMEEDARHANNEGYSKHKPAEALYSSIHVAKTLQLFKTVDYDQETDLGDGLYATFIDAGHILGSSSVLVHDKKKGIKLGFSGDLGRKKNPILKSPKKFENLNYLVLESTYGNKEHVNTNPADDLASIINETVEKGGSVIIPAFAVGRTQTLLYYLSKLINDKAIPNIPIYLNSPMASNVSSIYCKYSDDHHLSNKQCENTFSVAKFVRNFDESKALNHKPSPMIIISASGMASGGRVLHHLRRFLPDEKSTILFTGFQAPATRGDKIVNGAETVKIHGEHWPIKANIVNLESMSAHADQSEILEWLEESKISPKKIFIVHGEEDSTKALADKIKNRFALDCYIPSMNECIEL